MNNKDLKKLYKARETLKKAYDILSKADDTILLNSKNKIYDVMNRLDFMILQHFQKIG